MSINIQITSDSQGILRANVDPPFGPLAWYLEQDIQVNARSAEEVLSICAFVEKVGGEWTGTGNAHTVTISATFVRIVNEFADGPLTTCELSLSDFRTAVEAWLYAVQPWRARE